MKKFLVAFVSGTVMTMSVCAQDVKTVASVDLDRYVGKWYEIASFPNTFQKKCIGDVSADYRKREDGRIEVLNRCRVHDGSFDQAIGVAGVVDGSGNAKLKVKFMPSWLSWLPIGWGDYWIIGLAPDYSYAVVGDARREYLWVLSRSPEMSEPAYRAAIEQAGAQGYPLERLVKTRHGMKQKNQ